LLLEFFGAVQKAERVNMIGYAVALSCPAPVFSDHFRMPYAYNVEFDNLKKDWAAWLLFLLFL
jgi:hypothetical protein